MLMIDKVIGKADGIEITFEHVSGSEWCVTVPAKANGRYVVEVTVYDKAGNISYIAKMLWIVDATKLCVHMIPIPYRTKLLKQKFEAELCDRKYTTELLEPVCLIGGGKSV